MINRRKLFQAPQTYILLCMTGLFLLGFVIWLRPRTIVWISGGIITLGTIASWTGNFRKQSLLPSADNLLNQTTFLAQLNRQEEKIPPTSRNSDWLKTREMMLGIWNFASQIADKEPALIPDLLEALHEFLELSQQVSIILQWLDKIKVQKYQESAHRHLKLNFTYLQSNYEQLQQLYEQLILTSLNQKLTIQNSELPKKIKLMIDSNRAVLEQIQSYSGESDSL